MTYIRENVRGFIYGCIYLLHEIYNQQYLIHVGDWPPNLWQYQGRNGDVI